MVIADLVSGRLSAQRSESKWKSTFNCEYYARIVRIDFLHFNVAKPCVGAIVSAEKHPAKGGKGQRAGVLRVVT